MIEFELPEIECVKNCSVHSTENDSGQGQFDVILLLI